MLKRFARSSTGAVAAMTALLFPILLGVAGLGVELGFWYTVKRSMQGAADSAVYEAALTFLNGGIPVYQAHGKAVAAQNGWQDGAEGVSVEVNNPPIAGAYAGDPAAIEVFILRPQLPFMAWAVGYTQQTTIAAHAVMKLTGNPGNDCILALNTASNALSFSGNGTLSAPNCGVASNGSITFNGINSQLTAQTIAVGSNVPPPCPSVSPSTQCVVTSGPTGVNTRTATVDPYGDRAFTAPPCTPVVAACYSPPVTCNPNVGQGDNPAGVYCPTSAISGGNGKGAKGIFIASDSFFSGAVSVSGGTVTFGGLSTGAGGCPATPSVVYFDGGLSIQGQAKVTFCPGIYYIEGGSFSVTGNNTVTVTGTNVTFILTKSPLTAGPYATADIAGQGTVTLSAPTGSTTINLPTPPDPANSTATENTAGIVLFQDQNAPLETAAGAGISVGGNGTISVDGAIYSPTETVHIAGNGITGNTTTCTQIIAQFIAVAGNGASLQDGCTAGSHGNGTGSFGSGGTAALVE
jgi:hypothetical protein